MEIEFLTVAVGMVVGLLVGLTGLGGGVVLLPLLIYGLGVPPLIAVGSGAIYSSLTKVGAAVVHGLQRTVDWRLALALAMGSIPGAAAGVALLSYLRATHGDGVNDILTTLIGALLIVISALLVVQRKVGRGEGRPTRGRLPAWVTPHRGAALAGVLGGFLVGLTSVGSGSVMILILMAFFSRPPAVLVGTDIVHAVLLTGVTGLFHLGIGTVDLVLVALLLIGSIPGTILGARMTSMVPGTWLRYVVTSLVLVSGVAML